MAEELEANWLVISAAVLGLMQFVPPMWRAYNDDDNRDIDMLVLTVLSTLLWGVYAWQKGANAIVYYYIAYILLALLLIKLRWKEG